jgi:predicted  nucleic acid-binding Zn-ribbon protein
MLSPLLREIHRLRRLIRNAKDEVERAPRVLKAHQAKLAAQEKVLADAKEDLKKRKAGILTGEAQIKSLNQTLARHERQMNDLTAPRDVEAKQHDITNTKTLIGQTEDELLATMTDVDERVARMPELEAAVAKAKADFAAFEKEAAERVVRMKDAVATASAALTVEEAKIPTSIRPQYDRLVKAHGADALAAVENQSCSHCRVGITAQHLADLVRGTEFFSCRNCGRGLYLPG